MHRLKPTWSKQAILTLVVAIALLLPGTVAAAKNPSHVWSSRACATTLLVLVRCPAGPHSGRAQHPDRRRARRQEPTDRPPADRDGTYAAVAQHAGTGYGDWLRSQMRARRLTQRRLAQLTGISHSSISRFLCGERDPKLKTALAILAAFHEDPGNVPIVSRVERLLRSDERLDDEQVRTIMFTYLALRGKRDDIGSVRHKAQLVKISEGD
jgi:transcriptional regulator with XRE-family HTH domain